jgi:hypothetical protein
MSALLAALGFLVQSDATAPSGADAAITREELGRHVSAIATAEARPAGSEEAARVALYLAQALEDAGLAPGGNEKSFLLSIPVVRVAYSAPPELVLVARDGMKDTGVYGQDFNWNVRGAAPSTPELPILYVRGEGDLPDEPDPTRALFVLGTPKQRGEWLAWKGLGEGEGFGLDVVVASSEVGAFQEGRTKEAPAARLEVGAIAESCERVLLRGRVRERMLAEEYASLALVSHEERTPTTVHDVVGVLKGKSDEAILLVASYDYEGRGRGRRRERASGQVRYGASEAAANAALLELAQALADGPTPERTLVFLFTLGAADPQRFGARHYLEHPAVPVERTCVVLGFEGMGQPYYPEERGHAYFTGGERSSVGPVLAQAGLLADPDPRAHRYQRNESYAFALAGIVAHSIFSVPEDELEAAEDRPEALDYEHLEAATRELLGAVQRLSAAAERPAWTEKGKPSLATDVGPEDAPDDDEDD